MTTKITRLALDALELRSAARDAGGKAAARLLAVAFVLEGCTRVEAARRCGMDRQTLRDWVIRYTEAGIAGLSDRPHGGGTAAKLTDEEKAGGVREGPANVRSFRNRLGLQRCQIIDLLLSDNAATRRVRVRRPHPTIRLPPELQNLHRHVIGFPASTAL